eukprot:Platyproteum_vivax@DN2537_c0_g1_i1.p1
MTQLRYWTGRCVLGYMSIDDMGCFRLVSKQWCSIFDGECVRDIIVERFPECKNECDLDRRTSSGITDAQWLWTLQKNSKLIEKHRLNLSLIFNELDSDDDMYLWVQYGTSDTSALSNLIKRMRLELPTDYQIVDFGEQINHFYIVLAQPPSGNTELWTSYVDDGIPDPLTKVSLPVNCGNLRRLVVDESRIFLLTQAGFLWSCVVEDYAMPQCSDLELVFIPEPICKVVGITFLSVFGSAYFYNFRLNKIIPFDSYEKVKYEDIGCDISDYMHAVPQCLPKPKEIAIHHWILVDTESNLYYGNELNENSEVHGRLPFRWEFFTMDCSVVAFVLPNMSVMSSDISTQGCDMDFNEMLLVELRHDRSWMRRRPVVKPCLAIFQGLVAYIRRDCRVFVGGKYEFGYDGVVKLFADGPNLERQYHMEMDEAKNKISVIKKKR